MTPAKVKVGRTANRQGWCLWFCRQGFYPQALPGRFRTRALARQHRHTAAEFMRVSGLLSLSTAAPNQPSDVSIKKVRAK